jgi:hypothetical protein
MTLETSAALIGIKAYVVLGCLFALSGCQITLGPNVSTEPRTVTYRVSSNTTPGVSITYANATGGTTSLKSSDDPSMDYDGHLRWHKTLTLPSGTMPYLHAQNQFRTGSIRVDIESGGEVKSSESTGEYCVAVVSM